MNITKPIRIVCLTTVLFGACAKNSEDSKTQDFCEEARSKDKEIQAIVSDKSCSSNTECKSIAYGYKACGGPSSYLIYSTKNAAQSTVNAKVSDYNALAESCVKASKTVSDCRVPTEPSLSCLLSLCTDTNQ